MDTLLICTDKVEVMGLRQTLVRQSTEYHWSIAHLMAGMARNEPENAYLEMTHLSTKYSKLSLTVTLTI